MEETIITILKKSLTDVQNHLIVIANTQQRSQADMASLLGISIKEYKQLIHPQDIYYSLQTMDNMSRDDTRTPMPLRTKTLQVWHQALTDAMLTPTLLSLLAPYVSLGSATGCAQYIIVQLACLSGAHGNLVTTTGRSYSITDWLQVQPDGPMHKLSIWYPSYDIQ